MLMRPLQNIYIRVTAAQEAYFAFALGLLLAFNSGYINGICLSGLLYEGGSDKNSVTGYTGTITNSGLAYASGEVKVFGFEISLLLSFIGGAIIAGWMNPKVVPNKVVPSYGPSFSLSWLFMIAASISARYWNRAPFYFAAIANGVQNGMTSMYSAYLIRTTNVTGSSTDIGLLIGKMLHGNWKDYWKFNVLLSFVSSFWFGGFVSFYSASEFLSDSLWISAALYLVVGLTHHIFVVLTRKASFAQAVAGTWKWDELLERMATSMDQALGELTPDQIDHIFDKMDSDGSGGIDVDELKLALETIGIQMTSKNVMKMIAIIDEEHDGVIDRQEFHALVNISTVRAIHKQKKSRPIDKYNSTFTPSFDRKALSPSGTNSSGSKRKGKYSQPTSYGAV